MAAVQAPKPAARAQGAASAAVERTARGWWALALTGGLLGVLLTTAQTVERIAWAENPSESSICDVNSKLSCTGVFGFWQSSAIGIPNSLVGGAVFAIVASAAFAGLTGSRLSRPYLATMLGLTLFMTAFVTWYMAQTAFSMKVLCLYCLSSAVNIILVGIGLTRAVEAHGGLGAGRPGRALTAMVRSGSDLIAWLGLALLIAAMLTVGLVAL